MAGVVRKNDLCSGHGCFPPRPNIQGSPNIWANNIQVHRQGDTWSSHTCGGTHASILAVGSPNVFANNKPVGRKNDAIACGSICMIASSNVFANN